MASCKFFESPEGLAVAGRRRKHMRSCRTPGSTAGRGGGGARPARHRGVHRDRVWPLWAFGTPPTDTLPEARVRVVRSDGLVLSTRLARVSPGGERQRPALLLCVRGAFRRRTSRAVYEGFLNDKLWFELWQPALVADDAGATADDEAGAGTYFNLPLTRAKCPKPKQTHGRKRRQVPRVESLPSRWRTARQHDHLQADNETAAEDVGPSMVGYGSYSYTYESGHSGESCLAAFAVRARTWRLLHGRYSRAGRSPVEAGQVQLGKVLPLLSGGH